MRLTTFTGATLLVGAAASSAAVDGSFSPAVISARTAASDLASIDTGGDDELAEWLKTSAQSAVVKACPESCSELNEDDDDSGRYLIPDEDILSRCNETMLVEIVVKSKDSKAIRACVGDYGESVKAAFKAESDKAALCETPNYDLTTSKISTFTGFPQDMQSNAQGVASQSFDAKDAISALQQVSRYLQTKMPSCTNNVIEFGYSKSAAVGIFVGSEHHQHGLTQTIIDNVIKDLQEKGISETTGFELCHGDHLGADYSAGIILTSAGNLYKAKDALATWAHGTCFSSGHGSSWMDVTVRLPAINGKSNSTSNDTNSASTMQSRQLKPVLLARADCKTTTVDKGMGCWDVAKKCGITAETLQKYNPQKDFCNTLVVDQKVCCSSGTLPSTIPPAGDGGLCKTKEVVAKDTCGSLASKCGLTPQDFTKVNSKEGLCSSLAPGQNVCCSYGKLPDRRPKPNADGTCASITTQADDDCSKIAAKRDLTAKDIEEFNKNTWGWKGCDLVFPDYRMCVSKGDPPMPAPVANAVCGPTVPNTPQPPKETNLTTLNECPLKACCNVWGQCGLTDDFCTYSPSKSGAPGTSALRNGCVSNCGRELKKGPAPDKKMKVAYFEAWNGNRPCLHMDVTDIDTSAYTHIHFAFAEVTRDFKVDISKVQKQFDKFKTMDGIKKIISFGGWDFSALPGTFDILREAVKPANRNTFKQNVVDFVKANNLDGVDLDWEYPGAPDIPGIPSDDPHNGVNYYFFLKTLKAALGSDKSVSFAAPSSYWYMKSYPVDLMARDIDYIIFMTYDLHGQWDYGNKWTSPGCDTGNCLRSHVNDTETKDSLVMITKAGVPTNKVVVGVASYGRSFKMEKAGCDGPMCKFTGSPRVSNAAHGRCTDTGGYISNAEIAEIIEGGKVNRKWQAAGSDILVYNDTEWVAYMTDDTKAKRAEFYDSYNFLGTTDWAVDLQDFDNDGGDDDDDDGMHGSAGYFGECTGSYDSLDSLDKAKDSIPDYCVDEYATQVQQAMLRDAIKRYDDLVNGDYNHYFDVYAGYVKDQVPAQIEDFMGSKDAQQYFKCTETGKPNCCGSCHYFCEEEDVKNCDRSPGCDSTKSGTRDIDCPTDVVQHDFLDSSKLHNATFNIKDREGFFNALSEKYGIEESWVEFGRKTMHVSNGCQYAGKDVKECQDKQDSHYYGFPVPKMDAIHAFNPKDMIDKGYKNMTTTRDDMDLLISFSQWQIGMEWEDAADGTDIPAMSVVAAVDNMKEIRDKGKEIEKKEREEFILNMVLGILFFIPFVGEAAGAAGLTAARTLCRLIGDLGDIGLTVYGVVKDPKDAFGLIFGALMGRVLDNVQLGKAAKAGRDLKGKNGLDDLKGIKDNVNRLNGIRTGRVCKI
ncbi:Glycoside hydrolase, subgroup, catalytic core [Akanthomyces lecanii RCEF 1005]|uniref:chitinase n=1 Tax=Akanthomyces lecanii RCEF 1005 TaxID=1081108 RepID=A0A168C4Z8_CORDF|nr:Glycoside hydrolase, subgroup, catalytic core [Akanthomyces lecanii RCEF 1005]